MHSTICHVELYESIEAYCVQSLSLNSLDTLSLMKQLANAEGSSEDFNIYSIVMNIDFDYYMDIGYYNGY